MASMAMDMFHVQHTVGTVLCCLCGTSIAPNPSNMCVSCIRTQVDITEGLQKQLTILFCRACGRYLQPPKSWIRATLESKELLTYCLKRMKNLSKVKLVDASFVWTEPHSKRIKVKLTIQKDVLNGAILQQSFVAEYVVEDHMCDQCSRAAANPDQWIACVQVRQKVDHKRTFLFLEQLILKHGADVHTINMKQMHDGVDFFYANRSHALKFLDFLGNVVPLQSRSDKQLVSQDSKSNTYNYKFTFSAEICPICKDDLICLPQKVAHSFGNFGPIVLCLRVSNNLLLMDVHTLRTIHMDATAYWRYPFRRLLPAKQLVEYIVLDVEAIQQPGGGGGGGAAPSGHGAPKNLSLAEIQVARVSDFGKNDIIFSVTTHLGHILRPGDHALGYDLYGANLNDDELDKYTSLALPDVVLVRKSYEEKRKAKRGKGRAWRLKKLDIERESVAGKSDDEGEMADIERFMEEIEEDPELRSRIALYKDPNYVQTGAPLDTMAEEDEDEEEEGDNPPEVPLEELLSEMNLDGRGGGEDEEEDDEEDEGGEHGHSEMEM
eukprot:TRINITY_DN6737_c1_g1_i1.p1 TRINITY_DN6737_c1_g1~~TRINITY_DN6737_c1_g1_i1.p1  ORF type:complete len:549 (+),score=117.80 TRINITY_DN6737_c1_g1_i1:510-2156(+)